MAQLPPLVIGLVNSMPGEAFAHTERQFRAILAAAAPSQGLQFQLFSFDPLASAGPAGPPCRPVAGIDPFALDGLIVTGMPPRAAALQDEPYWDDLAALVDLACAHAIPAVWSCLAAHAAVLHLDGIERRRLPQKLSGVFECARTGDEHPIVAGLPPRWRLPHSRYNDLPVAALAAQGYRILSTAAGAGADLFIKEASAETTVFGHTGGAPFLFCQGHPEYDAQALLREYRRDVRHFLAGMSDTYPEIPHGCFGPAVAARLTAFRDRGRAARRPETMTEFPSAACEGELAHVWGDVTHALYANWLGCVARGAARRRHRPVVSAA